MRPTSILAGIALLLGTQAALAQKPATAQPNGELIYKTYCIGCHTTEVHWREKRLATDWASLKFQVRRWLDNNGIGLSEGQETALTAYLNRRYYKFPAPIAGYRRVTGDHLEWRARADEYSELVQLVEGPLARGR